MSDELKRDLEALRVLALEVADSAAIEAAFTANWGFSRSDDDGSMEQSCWDDGLKAFTAGVMYWRGKTAVDCEQWKAAFDLARDTVLHERGPLEGEGASSDVINAVLGILDDGFSELVRP